MDERDKVEDLSYVNIKNEPVDVEEKITAIQVCQVELSLPEDMKSQEQCKDYSITQMKTLPVDSTGNTGDEKVSQQDAFSLNRVKEDKNDALPFGMKDRTVPSTANSDMQDKNYHRDIAVSENLSQDIKYPFLPSSEQNMGSGSHFSMHYRQPMPGTYIRCDCCVQNNASSSEPPALYGYSAQDNRRYETNHVSSMGCNKANASSQTCEEQFKCYICEISFREKYTLTKHISWHLGIIKCSVCDKVFGEESELKNHMKVHIGENKCLSCGKIFADESDLKRHIKLHIGEIKCSVCGKSFREERSLKLHMNLHTGEIRCTVCAKVFREKRSLRKHMIVHTGETKCSVCFKIFSQSSELKSHMKVHAFETTCPVCEKTFGEWRSLKLHMNLHTGDIKCTVCGKVFREKRSLRKHMIVHTS